MVITGRISNINDIIFYKRRFQKMSDNPLISVVIPVYKVENYLRECLDSVISQTYKNLDIILVDDGSPDNCPAICDEYAQKDSRVRVIHKANGGPSSARNKGIKSAAGEYISFVDSDDYISPAYIEQMYSTLVKSVADVSCCKWSVHKENLRDSAVSEYELFSPTEAITEAAKIGKIGREPYCKLFRTSLHDGIYYPDDIRIGEDYLVTVKIFSVAKSIALSDNILYFHRLQENSLTHQFASKYMDFYKVYDIITDFVSQRFPEEWPSMSKHFRDDCIQVTMKILRDFCLSADRNSPEYAATISSLTERITLRGAISLMSSRATLPKKMAALLTALAPKLAVKIIERSRKYVPAYN